MLQPPRRLHGRRDPSLSPLGFFALTRVQREDVDCRDDDLWMVEEEIDRVDPLGIELGGERYWDIGLLEFTTTSGRQSTKPRRRLVVRYDAALLSRGVLDEVRLGEWLPDGRYAEHCRCVPTASAPPARDAERLIEARREYLRALRTRVARSRALWLDLESSAEAEQRLRAEVAAANRVRARRKEPPLPARPEVAGGEEAVRTAGNPLGKHLIKARRQRGDAQGRQSAPSEPPDPGPPARRGGATRHQRSAPDAAEGATPRARRTTAHRADHTPDHPPDRAPTRAAKASGRAGPVASERRARAKAPPVARTSASQETAAGSHGPRSASTTAAATPRGGLLGARVGFGSTGSRAPTSRTATSRPGSAAPPAR
jgi:hypothetical protein